MPSRPPLLNRLVQRCCAAARVRWFKLLSTNQPRHDQAIRLQPAALLGLGEITLHRCTLGYQASPEFWNGHLHLEAREPGARIVVGDNTHLNNGVALVAEKSEIRIDEDCLIGVGVNIFDSDFHDLAPSRRRAGTHVCLPVHIERNVFIGARAMILKGVTIGEGSVVAANAVVIQSAPPGSIIAGVPARIVGQVPTE